MADFWSIISSNYSAVGANVNYSRTKYTPVDKSLYEGAWSAAYANGQQVTIGISSVNGFRAKVRYQSGSTLQFQEVMIKDNSFKIGSTKFTLMRQGTAQIKTIMTDPGTGAQTLQTTYAQQN
jgi:hypothetical protein